MELWKTHNPLRLLRSPLASRKAAARPLVGAICFLAGMLFSSPSQALRVDLVSQSAGGGPGLEDSGSIRGVSELRPASVLDDGTVFFVSLARLAPADTNVLTDYYRAAVDGSISAIDLPGGFANGHFYWGGSDALGVRFFLVRQFADPSQFELQFGALAEKASLGVSSLVKAVDFASGGSHAVYTRNLSGFSHLFLHDLSGPATVETLLAGDANGDHHSPAISGDGNRIVFVSTDSSLAPGGSPGVADVYLYERASAAFTLISRRLSALASNAADSPDISTNGQMISFSSADPAFVPGDTNACSDVFVHHAGIIQRCSVASDGTQANAASGSSRLNASGRFVLFVSTASNLVAGVNNGFSQIFLFDRDTGQLEAVSLSPDGQPANAHCLAPEISPGGRYVTFVSQATNLSPGINGSVYQVYRADRGAHYDNHAPSLQRLSLAAPSGTSIPFNVTATDADQDELSLVLESLPAHGVLTDADGFALALATNYAIPHTPWLFVPADGSVFADSFTVRASDGKTNSASVTILIRMVDPDLGTVTRLSLSTDGSEGTRDSYLPYPGLGISADGSLVAFSSTASELDSTDADSGFADIFLRDTLLGSTRLASTGGVGNRNAYRCGLSGDGRTLVYYTEDGHLLLLQDLASGARTPVASISSYLSQSDPSLSHDGRRVVYTKEGQVWLFERGLEASAIVSVNTAGVVADASCAEAVLSADGRTVVFSSAATNLDIRNPGGVRSVYLRQIEEGLTTLISTQPSGDLVGNAVRPTLSASGRYVAFLADDGVAGDGIGTLYLKDLAGGGLRQVAVDAANPALSADGRFLCYTRMGANGRSQLYRADMAADAESVQWVSNAAGQEGDGDSFRGVLSASGRFVAFASQAENLVSDDRNGKSDVFLNDFGMPSNALPVPTLAAVATPAGTPLTEVPLTFTDAEDNDVRTEIVSGPAHAAQFVLHPRQPGQANSTFTYLPSANYQGEDSFSYRCGDASGWSAAMTVTITIGPVNTLPRWTRMPVLWGVWPGREFVLDLSLCVDDPDTANSDPDVLSFSLLQEAPEARIEGNFLIISAAGAAGPAPVVLRLGVADRPGGPIVAFGEELAIHVRAPVEIALQPGWNLISLPMSSEPSNPALLPLRPQAAPADIRPLGPVWSSAAGTDGYHRVEAIEPGRGYWVFSADAALVTLQIAWEQPVDPAVALVPGWNLAGPVGFGAVASPAWSAAGSPIAAAGILCWNGTNWVQPMDNKLRCGQGYWIQSPTAQTADLELGPVAE